jgi:hypothetical protein
MVLADYTAPAAEKAANAEQRPFRLHLIVAGEPINSNKINHLAVLFHENWWLKVSRL